MQNEDSSERYTKILQELIQIYSPSGQEEKLAEYIKETYDGKGSGWSIETDDAWNVYIRPENDDSSEPLPLLNAHLDTYPFLLEYSEAEKREIADRQADALAIYRRYNEHRPRADPALFVIRKKMGRSEYRNNCISASVLAAYREDGVSVTAGMDCHYLITDAKAKKVVPRWQTAGRFDVGHYRTLLRRAREGSQVGFCAGGEGEWREGWVCTGLPAGVRGGCCTDLQPEKCVSGLYRKRD